MDLNRGDLFSLTEKMRAVTFLSLILIILSGCSTAPTQEPETQQTIPATRKQSDAFQAVIDSADVKGTILVYDPQENIFYSNDFQRCDQGFLPASTYKIPNSIIALETGVVEDDSTFFKWDGEKRSLSIWERDMIFREAFHLSCVPCYQEIARKIGPERMNAHLTKFGYPGMVVDSSNIDVFWLEGDSRITPHQQMDFLKRFYYSQLPITKRTDQIMKDLMVIEEKPEYKLSGKTGWSIREGFNVGWFVAYLEKGEEVYFLVTNIEPKESFNMSMFAKIRKEIGMEAFRALQIIE